MGTAWGYGVAIGRRRLLRGSAPGPQEAWQAVADPCTTFPSHAAPCLARFRSSPIAPPITTALRFIAMTAVSACAGPFLLRLRNAVVLRGSLTQIGGIFPVNALEQLTNIHCLQLTETMNTLATADPMPIPTFAAQPFATHAAGSSPQRNDIRRQLLDRNKSYFGRKRRARRARGRARADV